MKAVSDLRGCRSPVPSAFSIGGRAITRDDLDPGMPPQPLGQSLGRALREQREVIHPKDCRSRTRRKRQLPEQTQQRVAALARVPPAIEVYPGRASQSDAESNEALGQPQRAPRPRYRYRRQPFGENPPPTVAFAAKPLADT